MKKSEFEKVIGGLEGGNISVLVCYDKLVDGLLKEVQSDHLLLEVDKSPLYITISAIQAIKKNSKDPKITPEKNNKKPTVQLHDVLFSLHYQWITLNELSEQPLHGVLCEIIETHVTLINYEEVLYVPLAAIQTVQKGAKKSLYSLESSLQTQNSVSDLQHKQHVIERRQNTPDLIETVSDVVELDTSPIIINESNRRNTISQKERVQVLSTINDIITEPESQEIISLAVAIEPKELIENAQNSKVVQENDLNNSFEGKKNHIRLDERRVLNNSSFRELMEMDSKDDQVSNLSDDILMNEGSSLENDLPKAQTIAGEKVLPCIDCLRELPGKLLDVEPNKSDQRIDHQNHINEMGINAYRKMSPEAQNAFLEKQYHSLMKHAAKNSISNAEKYNEESSNTSSKFGGSQTDSENKAVLIEKQYTALLKHAATMHEQIIYK